MAKLTAPERRRHEAALALLRNLSPYPLEALDQRWQVLADFQEHAENDTGAAGAFFTPVGMAQDMAIEVTECGRIIDLCAGIGHLAFAARHCKHWDRPPEIHCVEINPRYVEIGRQVLPEAHWHCGDVFEIAPRLGRFDFALSNPPFGRVRTAPRGCPGFECAVIELASRLADYGVFIVPQAAAGFRYSGRDEYGRQQAYTDTHETRNTRQQQWLRERGIHTGSSCGLDTEAHRDDWHQGRPGKVEFICCDFAEQRAEAAPGPLFAAA